MFEALYRSQYVIRQWLAASLFSLGAAGGTTRRGESLVDAPERVLFVMAGLIGDTVMSTPALIEARRIWPEAEIVLLGGSKNCELLKSSPVLTAVEEVPAIPFSIRRRRQISSLLGWIRRKNFDIAIILLGDQFAYALARAGIPVRVGVRGHVLEPCLTHVYDIGSPRTWGPGERLNSLRCLGYEVRDVRPMLWVEEVARESATARLAQLGLPCGSTYAIVHPFGSTRRQWWPVGEVAAVAQALSRFGVATVVVGGAEVRAHASRLLSNKVVNAVDELSIGELVAAIDSAAIVVSTDSGPFHIGGALGRPLIGLFRSRRPEHARRYSNTRALLGCSAACDIRCEWDSCRWDPCAQMASLSAKEVISAVQEVVGTISKAPPAVRCGDT